MSKWNMIIDVAECTNCQLCTLATMDEYVGNDWPGYAAPMPRNGHKWIEILHNERGQVPMVDVAYVPVMCNHCDDAPCIKAAKDGAITKRDDGIVIIDPVKAKGQQQLVKACPYGRIFWNEELQLPQHWNFDAHLIDQGWQQTRGQLSCPTGAMKAVKLDDAAMAARARDESLDVLQPELNTKPRVYYKNMWRYATCFIGGTVSTAVNGTVDCIEAAVVQLSRDGKIVQETTTDNYGDFKFDRLPPESGRYTVKVTAPKLGEKTVEAVLGESINLGEIRF